MDWALAAEGKFSVPHRLHLAAVHDIHILGIYLGYYYMLATGNKHSFTVLCKTCAKLAAL
ncbi:hypothetical protein BU24DRAFT_417342 [Aaosphaeria arxii CBS 175.79]|uniref:Uncharacterized protein n=1 Tax=Aaosphaeria arxii CBS 175.79 TaxID=1450172 RepID=A0A6A5Y8Y1_9PLEO|nr:uncharacterized protein BU24DRAFT_417342 [Aaosphaeria arxii CBS 175.79]KAF2021706.1 hypothetical protein BU24DRAFT_417342 [Aaosphaeria arxii CBS 175.79]